MWHLNCISMLLPIHCRALVRFYAVERCEKPASLARQSMGSFFSEVNAIQEMWEGSLTPIGVGDASHN